MLKTFSCDNYLGEYGVWNHQLFCHAKVIKLGQINEF